MHINIIMRIIGQNNKQISVVWIKGVCFSVDLAFENKMKQHINIYLVNHRQINAKITNGCFWIWFADKHLQILQAKHLQCNCQMQ